MPIDRFNDGLDFGQSMALLNEAQSVQNLLRDGYDAIEKLRHPLLHADAVFTLASIGVEKLMKITLGLIHLRDNGAWPSKRTMKAWGHGISAMDHLVTQALHDSTARATHTPYVETLLAEFRADAFWPLLMATLNRYGQSGRFFYLDHLADGKPDEWEPPIEYWHRLESSVTDAHPEILTMIASPDQATADKGYRTLSAYSAKSLERWWHLIHRCAIQQCFGERGATIGWEIWPADRTV